MPEYHPDWTSPTQGIVINNRLILDSECPSGTCSITYSDKPSSPTLTSLNAGIVTSGMGSLTLNGNNFNVIPSADVKVIFENTLTKTKTVVAATSVTATSAVATIPNLQGGYYNVRVRLDPIGETNSLELNMQTSVAATALTGSVKGGRAIITGTGLPAAWPSKMFSIKVLANTFYEDPVVLSATTGQLELSIG